MKVRHIRSVAFGGTLLGALFAAWWAGTWLFQLLELGRSSGWAKVDLVLHSMISGWPEQVVRIGVAAGALLGVGALALLPSVPASRRAAAWASLGVGAIALLVGLAAYLHFLEIAYGHAESHRDVQLALVAPKRDRLTLVLFGAAATLVLCAGFFSWTLRTEKKQPYSWLVTALVVFPCMLGSAVSWRAGSLFAWENAHPLDPKYAFANASLCCFGQLAVVGEAAHDPVEAPVVTFGSSATVDGLPATSREQRFVILKTKRELARASGREELRTVTFNARALGTVHELERELALAHRAGYRRVQFLFSRTHNETRPLLGALYGGRNTWLTGSLAIRMPECGADEKGVPLAPPGEDGVQRWLRGLAERYSATTHPCFLLPPLSCSFDVDECSDPRDLGWRVTEQEALGRDVQGLAWERAGERHLAAYVSERASVELHSFGRDSDAPQTFGEIALDAEARGRRVVYATNAGMYHADRKPVGLFVTNGEEHHALNTARGEGNFFLEPNGVFGWATNGGPHVDTTSSWRQRDPYDAIELASQSGPMLVIAGEVNPRFDPESDSRFVRNGVCVSLAPSDEPQAMFVISLVRVSLFEFAVFFRELGCAHALYFDGNVSQVYAPALGRADSGVGLGPVVAVTEAR